VVEGAGGAQSACDSPAYPPRLRLAPSTIGSSADGPPPADAAASGEV